MTADLAPSTKAAVETLARTLYGEARGEPVRGIEAVAAVILNRVAYARKRGGAWWGNDVVSVCRAPKQFSCWLPSDPNRKRLEAVTSSDPIFAVCERIARRALAGLLADPTDGATHYHTQSVHPSWAWSRTPCARIGNHLFYNTVE